MKVETDLGLMPYLRKGEDGGKKLGREAGVKCLNFDYFVFFLNTEVLIIFI